MLAEILLQKYEYHVPFYRQVKEYRHLGVRLPESTLNYSMKSAFSTISKIREVVDEVKPDIIHSHFVLTTLLMRMALRKRNIARVFKVPGHL